jgi:hypothetical protein
VRSGVCVMPNITKNEAIEMYARFLVSRHKRTAGKLARERADSLLRDGDLDGHKIWNDVADVADQLSARNVNDTPSVMAPAL